MDPSHCVLSPSLRSRFRCDWWCATQDKSFAPIWISSTILTGCHRYLTSTIKHFTSLQCRNTLDGLTSQLYKYEQRTIFTIYYGNTLCCQTARYKLFSNTHGTAMSSFHQFRQQKSIITLTEYHIVSPLTNRLTGANCTHKMPRNS